MKIAALLFATILLAGCSQRDGHASLSYYGVTQNDGTHVGYGSTDVRLFDMVSPNGHLCTVAATDNNSGGIAMYCWN
ncbi:hypothetical protein JFN94_06495 [Burkholderia anthina]|uniref:Lipoprotein n=1 Tax=Burkholderia anthina TaxID=179879 RepID=A0A7T6VHA8_9BURK|nr:hypothetical protein [Burkholderia anthina]QQK03806.1 hypothetical protein JFN94_06495 [Burkholderia anthina]